MPIIKVEQVPARLKEVRMLTGLSQKEFAEQCGITQGQVSHFELGRSMPGLETLLSICQASGLMLSELLGETPPKLRPPAPPTRAQKAVWILEEMQFTKPVIDRIRSTLGEYSGYL